MCRLLSCWFITISSLLGLSFSAFAEEVKLYSALGEPLLAEVVLQSGERAQSDFSVEGEDQSWQLLRLNEGALLLYSDQIVEQPILNLQLSTPQQSRPLVLFLHPMAPHAEITLLNALLQQQQQLKAQLEQVQQPPESSEAVMVSWIVLQPWILALLLGAIVAWLVVRWWQRAESVELSPLPERGSDRFFQAVDRMEQQIEPATVVVGEEQR